MIIFAADDERLSLELLEEAITNAVPDVTPRCFGKSSELLAAAQQTPPDIAFLDVEMPGLCGIDLAKALQELNPKVNIIFVTGYSEYLSDAMQLFASGYVMKPVDSKQIKTQMEHLRFPISDEKAIKVVTFGNFDIFAGGNAVRFRSPKSKELLAYLVDRQGATVTKAEAGAVLFEDDYSRYAQKELSRIAKRLSEDLAEYGIADVFIHDGSYRVDLSEIDCDMMAYLAGAPGVPYTGQYMEQYSWGEEQKYRFSKK